MLVYRVEHPDTGIGPYNYEHSTLFETDLNIITLGLTKDQLYHAEQSYELGCKHSITNKSIVTELDELGIVFNAYYYCGFNSLSAYHNWFNDSYKLLDELGYKLYTYEVDSTDVQEGVTQLAFDRYNARLVDVKDIEWN